jgi:CBS domain-containing protein
MATRWHLSLRGWVQSFQAWLGDPQAENLVNLQVFVDFRPVAGALSLEPRERVVDSIRGVTAALSYMARSCTRFVVPLGPFRSLRARGGRLDIKTGLVVPMVCAARVLALTAGSRARNTFLRLRAAAEAGLLAREDAGAAEEAFAFGLRLRLEHQLRALARGERPGNEIRVEELSGWEARRLREALWTVRQVQEALWRRYNLYLWG